MIVMKFGGTSIGNAERMYHVAHLVIDENKKEQVIVVVSAMHRVTDLLLEIANNASQKKLSQLQTNLKQLRQLHEETVYSLRLDRSSERKLLHTTHTKIAELDNLAKSIYELGEVSKRGLDLILSFGERLSVQLVAAAITASGQPAQPLEANHLLVTDEIFGSAQPQLALSCKKVKPEFTKLFKQKIVPVVTGFIGATPEGTITTLGRGGSDYTATTLGFCLDADEIWIWKDVDGAMTADPKLVKNAHTIPALSYDEAAELSYFGAKVLHPLTMLPAAQKNIPIRIKNTFAPQMKGTEIIEKANHTAYDGKAISNMVALSLITLQGKGMIGVPGVAAKVFDSIAGQNINVLFISQASSEYNISFVVRGADGGRAVKALEDAFKFELLNKNIESIFKEDDVAIVAVIGEGMKGRPGIAGKIFSALGDAGINTIAIAQGSSERNISLVVSESDMPKAVQSIHDKLNLAK